MTTAPQPPKTLSEEGEMGDSRNEKRAGAAAEIVRAEDHWERRDRPVAVGWPEPWFDRADPSSACWCVSDDNRHDPRCPGSMSVEAWRELLGRVEGDL